LRPWETFDKPNAFLQMMNTWLKHATTCLLLMVLFFSTSVSAHQTGNSYLYVTEVNGQLRIDIDFIVRDLDNLLQNTAQASKDKPTSTPTPEQLQAKQAAITQIIQASLVVEINEQAQTLDFIDQSIVLHNDGLYVRQRFSGPSIPVPVRFMVVRYGFFNQNDKLGRAFFKLRLGQEELSSVFDSSKETQRFALGESKRWATMGLFTQEGAMHIWGGPDHLLFLFTLLLPGLMLLQRESNTSRLGTRAAGMFALKVITSFTLAHSVTLLASVMDWITLPSRWIESAIALSIMLSAALNLQKRIVFSHWKLALVFGLIHGMGFANGLRELGLSHLYFMETLLAFNIGVELGQIAAVLAVGIPIVLLARNDQSKAWLTRWISVTVFLIALFWLIERLWITS
jgi:hypothetical protein